MAPAPRRDLDEVISAALARVREDGTARTSGTESIVVGGVEASRTTSESALRVAPEGPYIAASATTTRPGAAPTSVRLVVRPEAVYVSGPSAGTVPPGRPWTRLDAASRNPLTGADYGPIVALQRETGSRIFCFTELGPTTLVGASQDVQDGVPVVRYALHVDLTRPGNDAQDADQYRALGLSALDTAMYVDASDRVRRCAFDQALPDNGGRVANDAMFTDFGGAVDVSAPPPEQVNG